MKTVGKVYRFASMGFESGALIVEEIEVHAEDIDEAHDKAVRKIHTEGSPPWEEEEGGGWAIYGAEDLRRDASTLIKMAEWVEEIGGKKMSASEVRVGLTLDRLSTIMAALEERLERTPLSMRYRDQIQDVLESVLRPAYFGFPEDERREFRGQNTAREGAVSE